jgi:NADPH:quinone reductase
LVSKAVRGPAGALRLETISRPKPGSGEILIRVRAAGINWPDVVQRQGNYPLPPGAPQTLGLEVAGEVMTAAGRWRRGDRICALLVGGGYAEYATCDACQALPIPAGLNFTEAASLPEAVFTVYANVFERGALKQGETVLVHGANSGIGVTAIQMAKAAGAKVIATARTAEKAAMANGLGADVAVNTAAEDFAEVAQREGGVDVILDMVGGDYFAKGLEALKRGGRMVFIAAVGGSEVMLPIYRMNLKHAVITGSTLRDRSVTEKGRLAAEVERVVWPWIGAGKLKPRVDKAFPLAEAAKAHAYLESGRRVGKLVLTVD